MVGLLGILILLVVMIVLQMPVGFSMALVGFCGLWYVTGLNSALSMIGTETWSSFSSYGLTVIPLFIFMGTICFHSGVNKNLYQAAYLWFGRTRGGIAMATILACAGFAAIWGSTLPVILMALLFALTVYLLCVKHKDWGPGGPRVSLIDKLKALPGTIEMFVLFGLVMGGLYTGAYTPTEAGAAGRFFALVAPGAFS